MPEFLRNMVEDAHGFLGNFGSNPVSGQNQYVHLHRLYFPYCLVTLLASRSWLPRAGFAEQIELAIQLIRDDLRLPQMLLHQFTDFVVRKALFAISLRDE